MNTQFLATVLGWYLVVMSVLLLIRHEIVIAAIKDLIGQRSVMLIVGAVTFILGLLMVISHNVWVWGWPVIVTLIAWLVLIAGLFRLFFPDTVYKIWSRFIDKFERIIACGIITLVIGLFLLYRVYFG